MVAKEISQLDIFIASPGDLNEERALLKKSIDSVNKMIRGLGWHIELYGWEDTLLGNSRPQELINKDVDRCDLFLGMLWKRWGQPTGEYSSGFEEEFDHAKKRNSKTGSPEIWIFFKEIDPESLGDPGEQLKKVLSFKEEQSHLHERLYKPFKTPTDLKDCVIESLIIYIREHVNISKEGKISITEGSLPKEPEEPTKIEMTNTGDKEAIPSQRIELGKLAVDAFSSGTLRLSSATKGIDENFNIVRLYLISSTLMFHGYPDELLGTHEINNLYLYKDKLEMVPLERLLIMRTIIGGPDDVIPGWYWYKDIELDNIYFVLFDLVVNDKNIQVRMSAINLLRETKVRPKNVWYGDSNPIELLLKDNDSTLKPLILSYLAELGNDEDLELIDKFTKPEDKSVYGHLVVYVVH